MASQSNVSAVEIVMSWKGTVLESDLVEVSRPRSVLVGSEGAVRFLVPEEALPARTAEIVAAENGRFFLRAPVGTELVAAKDGVAIEAGLDVSGGRSVELVPGVSGEVRIGDFAFFARLVGVDAADAAPAFDFAPLRWVGATLAFHAVLLGSFLFTPPNASAMNLDLSRSDARYIEAHLTAPVAIEELLPELHAAADGGGTATGDHTPAPAPSGGTHGDVRETSGGPGRPTAHTVASPVVTASTVNNLAMFGAMASLFANAGPDSGAFGSDALDHGPGGPGLYAALVSGENGVGGPGVHGTGIGTCTGEHCGSGTVGVGPLATRDGHGGPGGELDGDPADHGPSITPGPVETFGGLGREEVRRTVRRHRNDVYSCYEAALRSNPSLEGRLTLAFQIAPDGAVRAARVASTEGNVSSIGSCVVDRLEGWTFPTSEGATGVTAYPFVFHTGE